MKKTYLFGALSSLLFGQAAVAALPAGGPAEAWTGTQIATQSGIIVGNIGSFTAGYSYQMQLNHQILKSEAILNIAYPNNGEQHYFPQANL